MDYFTKAALDKFMLPFAKLLPKVCPHLADLSYGGLGWHSRCAVIEDKCIDLEMGSQAPMYCNCLHYRLAEAAGWTPKGEG